MITKKILFSLSVLIFSLLYVLFGLVDAEPIYNFRRIYENSLVDPLTYVSLFSVFSTFMILFFSHQVFSLWIKKILSWFLPISLIILVAADPSAGGVASFSRTDYAIGLGFLLITITLIFALIQRFYFKR